MARQSKRALMREGSERVLTRLAQLDIMGAQMTLAERMLRYDRRSVEATRTAFDTIHAELNRRRADAIKDALWFGLLVDDDEMKSRIAESVLAWYGKERHAVMQLLSPDGEMPSRWRSDVEDEFRAEIRHALWDIIKPEHYPPEWRADFERIDAQRAEDQAELVEEVRDGV